jgi:hypothetical protein
VHEKEFDEHEGETYGGEIAGVACGEPSPSKERHSCKGKRCKQDEHHQDKGQRLPSYKK